jgi:hypothetical protein
LHPQTRHLLLFSSPNDVDTNFGGVHALRFLCSRNSVQRERDFFGSLSLALSRKKMMMMVRRWLQLPRFLACFFISAEANEREEMKLAVVRIFKISAPRSYHDSVSFPIEETQVCLSFLFLQLYVATMVDFKRSQFVTLKC